MTVVTFSGGVTTATVVNFDIRVTMTTILGTCAGEVKGSFSVKYTNTTRLLQFTTVSSSLKITSAVGACAGLIKVGDIVTLSSGTGGLILTGSPVNPISFSQP